MSKNCSRKRASDVRMILAHDAAEGMLEQCLAQEIAALKIREIAKRHIDHAVRHGPLQLMWRHGVGAQGRARRAFLEYLQQGWQEDELANVGCADRKAAFRVERVEDRQPQQVGVDHLQYAPDRFPQSVAHGGGVHGIADPHQQLVLEELPQLTECEADVRLAHVKSSGGRVNPAFLQQGIQHHQQVKVEPTVIHKTDPTYRYK
ncbi:putative protein OS=Sphingobium scionense OX=1404341 GN=GGQ90_003293 PE=4 SV=1 [Sphingobium scionense]